MAICAHTTCTCEAAEGSEFCADWCAANPSEAECHCHHSGCEAPHHH
jgi:hypothetical protein